MPIVAGADGCPRGWIRVAHDLGSGAVRCDVAHDARELLALRPRPVALVVDIPIGLLEHGRRECDTLTRRALRRRGSAVFSAPVRSALRATSWEEAHAATRSSNAAAGLPATGISKQAWGIFAKVRDVDGAMTPAMESWVHEGHPELAFLRWSGALLAPKRTPRGREQRARLIDAHFGRRVGRAARAQFLVRDVAHDDLHDAFACAWIAERIVSGEASRLPADPPRDARGLLMAIHA